MLLLTPNKQLTLTTCLFVVADDVDVDVVAAAAAAAFVQF